ncbi:MAG: GNAT family N-acetyltransferase [Solirubrobacteraceae bacterium]
MLPTIDAGRAAERARDGGRPLLVLDRGQPLFACWIFTHRAPMIAARGRWLALPEQVACLEDSVAASAARGRGIGPLTWTALAQRLAGEGKSAMITKVATGNAPSRRAVVKAGFREVAVMRLRRCGILYLVDVEVLDPDSLGGALRKGLKRAGF